MLTSERPFAHPGGSLTDLDQRTPLRVLYVEDDEDDVYLVTSALEDGGFRPQLQQVETEETMRAALEAREWDVVLADYRLPRFNAPAALGLVRERGEEIPFVVVSGAVGEEQAAELVRAGADDFVLKSRLARLGSVVERVLREAARRRERREALRQLRQSEEQLRFLADAMPQIVWTARADGWIEYGNRRWFEYTGLTAEQSLGWRWRRTLHPADQERSVHRWQEAVGRGEAYEIEVRFRRGQDAAYRWHLVRAVPKHDAAGRIVQWVGTCTDIDDQKRTQDALRHRDQLLQLAAQVARRLITTGDYGEALGDALRIIGEGTGADRVYLYENHAHPESGAPATSRRYEWCRPGVEPCREHPGCRDLAYDRIPRWPFLLSTGSAVSGPVEAYPEEERALFAAQQVRSLLAVPVVVDGAWWGFVGLDDCSTERLWTPTEEAILSTVAALIGGTIKRMLTEAERTALLEREQQARAGAEAAERRAAELAALLDTLIDQAPVGFAFVDPGFRFLRINEMLARMNGRPTAAHLGRTVEQMLGPDAWARLEPHFRTALAGEPVLGVELSMDGARRDDVRHTFTSYYPVRARGRIRGVGLVVSDITDRKQMEEALRERAEELVRSNRELEQFAYVASHDLKEPLRSINGCVKFIARRYQGQLDAEADELIGITIDAVERMYQLIEDLLAYSRVERQEASLEPLDLGLALDGALINLRAAIEETGAAVTREELPVVHGSLRQFSQLFQNLVSNAIKFRRPEDPPRIHVSASREGSEWIVSVSDNGIGFEPKFAERIFMLFQRLHTRSEYEGTGIGLAISKKIVERHGGRIWVDSEPGRGSTFYFALPAE